MFRCICTIFRQSYKSLKTPEDDADASKRVGVLTTYKIFLIYICCAFVGLDNKSGEKALMLTRTYCNTKPAINRKLWQLTYFNVTIIVITL